MADVTISSLPLGTPSGSVSIPYSDGNTTYSARPSAIVAASSGSVLQMQFVPYVERYNNAGVSTTNWQSIGPALNLTTKAANSKIYLINNISIQVWGTNPYAFFSFLRGTTEVTGGKDFGIITRTNGNNLGWDNMTIQFVDQPNAAAGTVLSYYLAIKSRSGFSTKIDINDSGTGSLTHFVAMEIAA